MIPRYTLSLLPCSARFSGESQFRTPAQGVKTYRELFELRRQYLKNDPTLISSITLTSTDGSQKLRIPRVMAQALGYRLQPLPPAVSVPKTGQHTVGTASFHIQLGPAAETPVRFNQWKLLPTYTQTADFKKALQTAYLSTLKINSAIQGKIGHGTGVYVNLSNHTNLPKSVKPGNYIVTARHVVAQGQQCNSKITLTCFNSEGQPVKRTTAVLKWANATQDIALYQPESALPVAALPWAGIGGGVPQAIAKGFLDPMYFIGHSPKRSGQNLEYALSPGKVLNKSQMENIFGVSQEKQPVRQTHSGNFIYINMLPFHQDQYPICSGDSGGPIFLYNQDSKAVYIAGILTASLAFPKDPQKHVAAFSSLLYL